MLSVFVWQQAAIYLISFSEGYKNVWYPRSPENPSFLHSSANFVP